MKMRTKKCGVFAALAVALLVMAALITTCADPVGSGDLTVSQDRSDSADFTPPPGMGYIRLNIVSEGSNARTVLPTAPVSWNRYTVIVKKSLDSTVVFNQTVLPANLATAVVVVPDTYIVEVQGFVAATDTVPAAVGITNNVSVVASASNTATVNMRGIVNNATFTGGSGTFTWSFAYTSAGSPDSVTMTVTNWGTQTATIPATLTGADVTGTGATGSESLPSGYYYVAVTLAKAKHQSQTYLEILHVYNSMTSTYSKNDFGSLGRNYYDVTYDDIDAAGTPATDDNSGDSYLHGSLIDNAYPSPTDPTSAKVFGGWYKTLSSGAYSNPWDFATDKIIKELNLYGQWVAGETVALTVNFTVDSDFSFTLTGSAPSFSHAALGTAVNLVSITLSAPGDLTDIVWKKDGTQIGTGTTLTLANNDAYIDLLVISTYPITVEGKLSIVTGGVTEVRPFLGTIMVTITS